MRQTYSVFFHWWAKCRCIRVPSKVCCGTNCPVTGSPSCERLHRQTVKPLPPTTCVVSSSTYPSGGTQHGAVTASNGACTTKMLSQQRQKDQIRHSRTLPLATILKLFLLFKQAARRLVKKNIRIRSKSNHVFLWSDNSVGHKVRSSRPSARKFTTSPHGLDDVEKRPPLRTPACNHSGNQLQHRQSNTNQQQRKQYLKNVHMHSG